MRTMLGGQTDLKPIEAKHNILFDSAKVRAWPLGRCDRPSQMTCKIFRTIE